MNKVSCCKRWMKIVLLVMVCIWLENPVSVEAAKKITEPGAAATKGQYIYYAYEMKGIRMGIIRYDTKTNKQKTLVSYMYKGNATNGFYNINVTNKYIVANWNRKVGSDATYNMIYRFNRKNGKGAKKLAVGRNPVVIGNYVYYVEGKISKNGRETYDTGYICRVELDGKHKKRLCKTKGYVERTFKCDNKFAYAISPCYPNIEIKHLWGTNGKKVKFDANSYNINRFFKNKTGTYVGGSNEVIFSDKNWNEKIIYDSEGAEITSSYVCGSNIMLRQEDQNRGIGRIVIVNKNGKDSKVLKQWNLAE